MTDVLPTRMQSLGYVMHSTPKAKVIIPPVCDVPAGPFLMGIDWKQDPHDYTRESRQLSVSLDAYQLTTFPVTVAEYACAVCAQTLQAPHRYGTWIGRSK